MRATLLLVALAGCLRATTFHCATDGDCMQGGAQGTCEGVGFCSFADPSCTSGKRFGDFSQSYSNQCVGDQPPLDARADTTTGPKDAPAAPFCDAVGEPALVGCWEFENDLLDHSGDNNNGTGTGTITYAPGKVGMAVSAAAGHIAVADSVSLAPATTLTIEGWIHPTTLPTGGARMGIVDNDSRYGFFLVAGGLSCTIGIAVSATVTIAPNAWTHVACTADGTTGRIYVNGVQVGITLGTTTLGAGNGNGVAIAGNSPSGDALDGLVDQLRIWNVARTTQQICQAAGVSGC